MKQTRKLLGLSAERTAHLLGYTLSGYSKIEREHRPAKVPLVLEQDVALDLLALCDAENEKASDVINSALALYFYRKEIARCPGCERVVADTSKISLANPTVEITCKCGRVFDIP